MKTKKIMENKIKFFRKGVSIIEALVLVFVFSVVALSFYSVFSAGSKYIINSKNKIIAVSLTNERMEMLRNLAYGNVGTIGGLVNGPIDPDEEVVLEGKTFRIFTDVKYVDDPDDGIFGGSPNDSVPNDYKIVEVMAYWGEENDPGNILDAVKRGEGAMLSSRFVPPGIEVSVGGGTFSINSIDYVGNPVPNVSVNIFNDQLIPAINYSTSTDSNGNIMLQGVRADAIQNYKITMSKSDYETVVTYSPAEVSFIPQDTHSNIIEGVVNEKTMIINLLSDIELNSKDAFGADIPNVGFELSGGRRLDDGTAIEGVYSYMETVSTDGNGDFSVADIKAGRYALDEESLMSGNYIFRKVQLGSDLDPFSFDVIPGTTFSSDLIFMDANVDSAYIKIKDLATDEIIIGAEVRLRNVTLGYEATLITDKYGYVYFPSDMAAPLVNGGDYEVVVTASGYQDNTSNIVINKLTSKTINLEAS